MTPPTPPPTAPMRRPLRVPGPSEVARVGGAVEHQAGAVIWWALGDVARALACSTRTVRRLCADGALPYARMPGGSLRFEPALVRAWCERQRVGGVR